VSQAANHWLDLAYQVVDIGLGLVPALLAVHLIGRTGDAAATFGFGSVAAPLRPGCRRGPVSPSSGYRGSGSTWPPGDWDSTPLWYPPACPQVWWAVPVLLLSALQNAALEELVVVGYLVTRLRQFGWSLPGGDRGQRPAARLLPLYQGFGGFLGNAVMGVIFALFSSSGTGGSAR